MTLLDGGGGSASGGGTEVTTLSRPIFHRNGNASKKNTFSTSDINANTMNSTNENFAISTPNSASTEIRRVPEMQNCTSQESQDHDLKKWSEMCKMNNSSPRNSASAASSSNGDSNNNHSANGDSVLPEMDFSN